MPGQENEIKETGFLRHIVNSLKNFFKSKDNTSETASKKVYADIVVQNQRGEILLLERSYNDDFMPGKWCLPGGKVELGESHATAASRELVEETLLSDLELKYLLTVEKEDCRIHYYVATLVDPPFIVLDNAEHYRLEFVKLDEVKDYNTILDFDNIFENKIRPLLPQVESIGEEYSSELNKERILVQIQKAVSLELLSRGCDEGVVDDDKYLTILQKALNTEAEDIPNQYKFKSLRKYTRSLDTEVLQKALDKDRILF